MSLVDLLYPRFCLGCTRVGTYLCPSCFKKLRMVRIARCLYCKKHSYLGLTHPKCLKRLYIDGSFSLFYYTPLMRKVMKNIKYRLAQTVFDDLVKNIEPDHLSQLFKVRKLFKGALIQPIPLTQKRLKSRGFNQASLVLSFFNSVLGLKVGKLLARVKDASPQAGSTFNGRSEAVIDAFKLKQGARVKNRVVVLVDDVITTGATVHSAARILKARGALRVYVLSLASG